MYLSWRNIDFSSLMTLKLQLNFINFNVQFLWLLFKIGFSEFGQCHWWTISRHMYPLIIYNIIIYCRNVLVIIQIKATFKAQRSLCIYFLPIYTYLPWYGLSKAQASSRASTWNIVFDQIQNTNFMVIWFMINLLSS